MKIQHPLLLVLWREWSFVLLLAVWCGAAMPAMAQPAAVPPLAAASAVNPVLHHAPDARTVQRWGQGWRYPQAGWTVVHIEGEPHARGLQHGRLLAAEIAGYIRALSQYWGPARPQHAWETNRQLARQLFYSGFTPEQMQEMQGIAEGASAAGARVGARALDVLDIITINTSNEIDSVDDALAVTPDAPLHTPGITPRQAAKSLQVVRQKRRRPQRCNAFVANGPATADGQIVFGHITMYDLYPANFYNVWMEVKPAAGYRFVMQTTPGGIHSSMDYVINEAGLLLAETTLDQGPMVIGGVPLAARIRQAQQYADSIESAVSMLTRNDNGLCSTEWVLGDIRRNEIALLTLGGDRHTLHRSSRNEWIEGAEGFYWSDNNIKDQTLRLRTDAQHDGRPSALAAYAPSKRDAVWLRKYHEFKGRMGLDFARQALTTPEIVSAYGVDAKYTNADLAANLQSWASFGPPVGALWLPILQESRDYSAVQPLIHNPWTLLQVQAPPALAGEPPPVQDAADPRHLPGDQGRPSGQGGQHRPLPAWQGTLQPASDADIWLSTAFANLERIVTYTRHLPVDRKNTVDDAWGTELAYYRSQYGFGARAGHDVPLSNTRASMGDQSGYRVATGKGVLFLHALRGLMGEVVFDRAMQEFGRQHGGQKVSTQQFQDFLQRRTAYPLTPVFDWWLHQTGLPYLAVQSAQTQRAGAGWETVVTLDVARMGPALAVPVTVETEDGASVTRMQIFDTANRQIRIATAQRPRRVVVDKYGTTPRANGSPFTILTMDEELEKALIVYGTLDEATGNHEAARLLQTALRRREHNVQPQIRSDREVSEQELRNAHLLLVGRPATNAVSQRFAAQVPVEFGPRSFTVRDQLYVHPQSAVLAAGDNPLNSRYSVVLIAGLGSLATYQTVARFADDEYAYAPMVVLPHARESRELVTPLPELTVIPQFP